jgi:hypothetical protein
MAENENKDFCKRHKRVLNCFAEAIIFYERWHKSVTDDDEKDNAFFAFCDYKHKDDFVKGLLLEVMKDFNRQRGGKK